MPLNDFYLLFVEDLLLPDFYKLKEIFFKRLLMSCKHKKKLLNKNKNLLQTKINKIYTNKDLFITNLKG